MKFSIPTNFDAALIEGLAGLPVYEVFGSLPQDPVGSGRAKLILPQIDEARVKRHIDEVHAKGFGFNYLLNAPCMGNMEYDKTGHARLLDHLSWIDSLGVDSVTVAIPYLVELIRRQFQRVHIKVSVIAQVNSVPMLRAYEGLGAHEVNLDYMCNRDFVALEALKKAAKCELTLLANDVCLYKCPYRLYHYNLTGHSTQAEHPLKGAYFDYCMVSCTVKKLTEPEQLIRARWIRPEDLEEYERLGYERFKLSGRNMSTEWILRTARAYAERRYSGNLGDLLSGSIPEASGASHYRIEQSGLDGFLEAFKTKDCARECGTCDHCASVARRAVSYPNPRTPGYVKSYQQLLDGMISSELFRS